jgi:L-ascorbate metabolism protein UlaG (beta-lactamase superfamily)
MPHEHKLVIDSTNEPVDHDTGSVYFIGTATTVIRIGGFTVLTDPNFLHAGDHVHLGYGLTSERLTEPAIDIEELPEVDLCVLSHYHGDHFDQVAQEKLRKDLPIITTEHAAENLGDNGFTRAYPLETWDAVTVEKGNSCLKITSMPGQHGPGIVDFALPPVMGSILDFLDEDGGTRYRLYITGDTLIHDDLNEIPKRFPGVDLVLLHLGGTRVLGIMVTMDDEEGVKMLNIVRPAAAIPIHYNDYDVFKSPLEDFKRAAEAAGWSEKMIYLAHGETHTFRMPQRSGANAA